MGGKWVVNLKQKCYKTAKNAQKYSYFGQIVDFNDWHQIFLRRNSPPQNVIIFFYNL